MKKRKITENDLKLFAAILIDEEKSDATVEKYLRDARAFVAFLDGRDLSRAEVLEYKSRILSSYAVSSANSMLVSVNTFLESIGRSELKVRLVKVQRKMFISDDKTLTARECRRLIEAARGSRTALVIRAICETGIRVSELRFITVEALAAGRAEVDCKGKTRVILIPGDLRRTLLHYAKTCGIKSGSVFVTKGGRPLDRSNIWRDMKALCERAGVERKKVFPHNLRHLFARTFYTVEKDIVRLADLLGHSSINTTRIYTAETEKQHLCSLERACRALMT